MGRVRRGESEGRWEHLESRMIPKVAVGRPAIDTLLGCPRSNHRVEAAPPNLYTTALVIHN
jgi:hypothetical protein